MIINLSDPFFGTIAASLIVAIIIGTWHYVKLALAKKTAENQLSDVLSEINSLHKKHQEEISKIEVNSIKTFQTLLEACNKELGDILNKHYDPLLESLKPVIKQSMAKKDK
jgi:hypothetical protein